MKTIIFILILLLDLNSASFAQEVKIFGFYSNENSSDGEHSIGYTLQLWNYNKTLIGNLRYNEGSFGIDITGFISKVAYNPDKKTLSFESNLNGSIVKFKGKIYSTKIVGKYSWKSRIDKNKTLSSCCSEAEINVNYSTYADWLEMWKRFK